MDFIKGQFRQNRPAGDIKPAYLLLTQFPLKIGINPTFRIKCFDVLLQEYLI